MIMTHTINVDLIRNSIQNPIDIVQGDSARSLEFVLKTGKQKWKVPENATALIRYSKPDYTSGVYDTLPDGSIAYTIKGNCVTVALAPQVTTAIGPVRLAISVICGHEEITTFSIPINVVACPGARIENSEDYLNIHRFVPITGWAPDMYLGTDAEGRVIAKPMDLGKNRLTEEQISALDHLFQAVAYVKSDVSKEYTAFQHAFGIGIPATAIRLSPTELKFTANGSQKVDAVVEPAETTDVLIWSTDNDQVAVVENGIVTPVGNGNCKIEAHAGSVSAACTVNVSVSNIVTYTVTSSLKNCTSDNSTVSVVQGEAYTAQLTADQGYTMDGALVQVSVGGIDVTDTAYSAGRIDIRDVTGDIAITASAVKCGSMDVRLVKSVITDGKAWIDTGFVYDAYKYRLEFGLEFPDYNAAYEYMGINMYNYGTAYKQFVFKANYNNSKADSQYVMCNGKTIGSTLDFTNGQNICNIALHEVWTHKEWKLYFEEEHKTQPTYPWYKDRTFDLDTGADPATLPIMPIGLFKTVYTKDAQGTPAVPIAGTKWYYFRVYDMETNQLLVDIRPAVRGAEVGMYDVVASKFISASDGTLTYEEAGV